MKYLSLLLWCATTIVNIVFGYYYAAALSCSCIFYCYGIHRALQQRDYWRGRWAGISKKQPK